ncbi:putative hydrolase or acyltransferase of alpha/beta superfamily (plasmid) [Synechococcus sp. PCC 7502]|uniref:alpha/beta fold hydrolase n=1 Tax=Synechococcus sp. PCC 7502 TaxID=1173263 RepID=UPI00029F8C43|nr:alpha/beta hydrolase [Synechococcus sp. PCC 7502]AFY75471.1 putative hydrolase or acyltransferase of alpha/beta superfamily [Synechococcus sp. PCC 7502]
MSIFPLAPLIILLLGLLSTALFGFGLYFVIGWYLGWITVIALFISGIVMLVFSLLGRFVILWLLANPADNEPTPSRSREVKQIHRPDGTNIHVELFGDRDAPPIIFTHGWSCNSTHWYYIKQALVDEFRLILWDVPGSGKSGQVPAHDYSMQNLATDLEAVLHLAGDKPAIIFGHSMGGMILLTFCRLFPQHLGTRVAGIGLVNTTFTNPVHTAPFANILQVLQKPLLEPLLYLMIGLSPLVWAQTWLSYLNGTSHISGRFSSFAGRPTRGQLDYLINRSARVSPSVLGRQMLGMMHYDATEVLKEIEIPTLIISANKDGATPVEASRYMHEQIENSELVVLAPSGHMSMMEQHQEFVEAVANFVRHCSRSTYSSVN